MYGGHRDGRPSVYVRNTAPWAPLTASHPRRVPKGSAPVGCPSRCPPTSPVAHRKAPRSLGIDANRFLQILPVSGETTLWCYLSIFVHAGVSLCADTTVCGRTGRTGQTGQTGLGGPGGAPACSSRPPRLAPEKKIRCLIWDGMGFSWAAVAHWRRR